MTNLAQHSRAIALWDQMWRHIQSAAEALLWGPSSDIACQQITCEVDGADGIDVVVDIGRVGPPFSSILSGELRARPLQPYPEPVSAAQYSGDLLR